jgi:hypothetical protein
VLVAEIRLDQRPKALTPLAARRSSARVTASPLCAAGPLQRFDEQRVSRIEVGIEAAMSEAGLLHDVSDADTRVAVAPDRP